MSDINRRVAEYQGYTIEYVPERNLYYLAYPLADGQVGVTISDPNPETVWRKALSRGLVPDYEHDLNAAIKLVDDLTLERVRHPREERVIWRAQVGFTTIEALHDDPATAICEAFLAQKDAQEASDAREA